MHQASPPGLRTSATGHFSSALRLERPSQDSGPTYGDWPAQFMAKVELSTPPHRKGHNKTGGFLRSVPKGQQDLAGGFSRRNRGHPPGQSRRDGRDSSGDGPVSPLCRPFGTDRN